jgi:hypothetical protein
VTAISDSTTKVPDQPPVSRRSGLRRASFAAATVGLLAVAGAAVSGANFASQGHDSSSLAMALLTGVALLCYGTTLLLLPRGHRVASQRTRR